MLQEYEKLVELGTTISLLKIEESAVLTETPIPVRIQVAPQARMGVSIAFLTDNSPVDPREALIIFTFFDKSGRKLNGPYAGLQISAALGSFRYLDPAPRAPNTAITTFLVPAEAVSAVLAFRKWRSTRTLRLTGKNSVNQF